MMATILDERDDRDANGSSVNTLYVRYDGEALRTHEMDVKQLAPALLSLAKAFDTLQKDVAPGARVQLNAKATREGSFDIDLLSDGRIVRNIAGSRAFAVSRVAHCTYAAPMVF